MPGWNKATATVGQKIRNRRPKCNFIITRPRESSWDEKDNYNRCGWALIITSIPYPKFHLFGGTGGKLRVYITNFTMPLNLICHIKQSFQTGVRVKVVGSVQYGTSALLSCIGNGPYPKSYHSRSNVNNRSSNKNCNDFSHWNKLKLHGAWVQNVK